MLGEEPYELSCETPCRNGQTEEDGLCVGEAITPCVDVDDKCTERQKMGECENNPDFMEKNCRETCKICTSKTEESSETGKTPEEDTETGGSTDDGSETGGSIDDKTETGGSTEDGSETGGSTEDGSETGGSSDDGTESGGSTEDGSETGGSTEVDAKNGEGSESGQCKDNHKNCFAWAASNHCHQNPGYMSKNCKKSCKRCKVSDSGISIARPDEDCKDENERCQEWAYNNQCNRNRGYMFIYCKKSCNVC